MERKATPEIAKKILGKDLIGFTELEMISGSLPLSIKISTPLFPYSIEFLEQHRETHLLILGLSQLKNGKPITIRTLREYFGFDPDVSEPCFYNQDWYLKENFIDSQLQNGWFLIGKDVIEETKGKDPSKLIKEHDLPSSIQCTFTFFVYWYCFQGPLWQNNYIWCSDLDHNGDRIYVGRYHDSSKINKNGFSIHRHLSINNSYGCVGIH